MDYYSSTTNTVKCIWQSVISGSLSARHGRPRIADGGTASDMEGSCKNIEKAVEDSQQGVVLQLGGWARC